MSLVIGQLNTVQLFELSGVKQDSSKVRVRSNSNLKVKVKDK